MPLIMILGSEQASLNEIIEPRVLYWDGYYAQHTQSFICLICYAYIPVYFLCTSYAGSWRHWLQTQNCYNL